jgi:hypothetical protein
MFFFTAIFMTVPKDTDNSKQASKLASKKVMVIMIIVGAVILFAIWFFFIPGVYNPFYESDTLPPNCYSLNGKRICPSP